MHERPVNVLLLTSDDDLAVVVRALVEGVAVDRTASTRRGGLAANGGTATLLRERTMAAMLATLERERPAICLVDEMHEPPASAARRGTAAPRRTYLRGGETPTWRATAGGATGLETLPPIASALRPLRERPAATRPLVIVLLATNDRLRGRLLMGNGVVDYILARDRVPGTIERSLRFADALRQGMGEAADWHDRYRLLMDGAADGLWDWNLVSNQVIYSARWKGMVGHDDHEVGESPSEWFDRIPAEERQGLFERLAKARAGETAYFEGEYPIRHQDGHCRWVRGRAAVLRDADGTPRRMAGSQTDITRQKSAEQQRHHEANHDPLTGLPNRFFFMEVLDRLLGKAGRRPEPEARPPRPFAVLFVDLDGFRTLNKSLGHLVGDEMLVATVGRLRRCLDHGDTIARVGGDEFAILRQEIRDATDATRLADAIQRELMSPFLIDGQELFTTASIGIAVSASGYRRPEEMLRDAHTAMYRAKSLGRARHEVFDKAMHALAVERLQMETDLRRAIDRHEFRVHYQPIVSFESGRLVAFEALARWFHPHRGLIHPSEFIPIAEETGLIEPLGHWVLREACQQTKDWQTRFARDFESPLAISVNLSNRQFAQPDLIRQIRDIQRETGLNQRSLRLEITESVMMHDIPAVTMMLGNLKDLGIPLYIDDFGTGYSSLAALPTFPIDTLKIDRSFVHRMEDDRVNKEIVRTILGLAMTLGMDVVAEGVETADQCRRLRSLECSQGQGYYFSRPLDGPAAERLLMTSPQW